MLIGTIHCMIAFCDVISRSFGKRNVLRRLFATCILLEPVTIPHMSIQHQSYLSVIQAAFPGKVFLSVDDAARALSRAVGAIRNDISDGSFPIKTVKIGARRLIPILELALYMDQLVEGKPHPGRPRTASKGKGVLDV